MATESPSSIRKVVVHLRATGDAPILKQAKFKRRARVWLDFSKIFGAEVISPDLSVVGHKYSMKDEIPDKFAKVIDFLRRQLFVYVNSAFSPNPDELVIDLYNNFGFDGKLVVNYACSMAWG